MKCVTLNLIIFLGVVVFPSHGQPPFFAFCMDTHDAQARTLEEQAALLKELGYDGADHLWLENLEERIRTLDAVGLRLFQVYLQVDIASDQAPYPAGLKEALALLAGRETQLALLIAGMPPSDKTGDARAVEIVREIADMAARVQVQVVLYPHAGDWLERVKDAVRIAEMTERDNVGVMFNLCHWLKVDGEENLKTLLALAMPRLFAVSINGADGAAQIQAGTGNWIQPLDSGSFNLRAFLNTVFDMGYDGPIGLQCYGIPGDAREHLSRSMAVWRKLHATEIVSP